MIRALVFARPVVLALLAVGTGLAKSVEAQSSDVEALDHIEAAVDSGRVDGLRQALEAWMAAAEDPSAEDRGRAGYLRARLLNDLDSARAAFAGVALDGRSSYGARAWLRLAQMDLALGESLRALSDLERLRADYPAAPVASQSWYWTARAWEQRGELEHACENFARAVAEGGGVQGSSPVERARDAARGCAPGGLRFSLQVGAFSRASAAEIEQATLSEFGYSARLYSEDGLHKVRVGRFANPEAARSLAKSLRIGGFSVAIVAAES